MKKIFQEADVTFMPANRRRHLLRTGAGIMIKDTTQKTFQTLAKFSGKYITFYLNVNKYGWYLCIVFMLFVICSQVHNKNLAISHHPHLIF